MGGNKDDGFMVFISRQIDLVDLKAGNKKKGKLWPPAVIAMLPKNHLTEKQTFMLFPVKILRNKYFFSLKNVLKPYLSNQTFAETDFLWFYPPMHPCL